MGKAWNSTYPKSDSSSGLCGNKQNILGKQISIKRGRGGGWEDILVPFADQVYTLPPQMPMDLDALSPEERRSRFRKREAQLRGKKEPELLDDFDLERYKQFWTKKSPYPQAVLAQDAVDGEGHSPLN